MRSPGKISLPANLLVSLDSATFFMLGSGKRNKDLLYLEWILLSMLCDLSVSRACRASCMTLGEVG